MDEKPRTLQIGSATITLFNAGTLSEKLTDWFATSPEDAPRAYAADFNQAIDIPVLCFHIALPGHSILVDACDPESLVQPDKVPPGYQPRPSFTSQLAAAGIQPETIDHLIITHSHFDHYNGITQAGRPCFPRARHYLGQADWNQLQEALAQPDSLPSQTLGIVSKAGLLELVDHRLDLVEGVQIIPTPGETPGHQIVRVQSEGQTLYCLGDLYHHPVEVDYPDWHVHWAEPESTRRSRQALVEAALAEEALLLATHIFSPGRLVSSPAGAVWSPV